MASLVGEICRSLENEATKTVSVGLKLSNKEEDLLKKFQKYVGVEVAFELKKDGEVNISMNDLVHNLIFSSISSDKKFQKMAKAKKIAIITVG
jgi:hypothetical protein